MYEKYQLSNGLQVILVPSSKAPVVTAQIWVKTGSADEKKGEEGLSHFIEHLLFKGTEKYKVGEIAQEVEGSGGQLNAYTSFDQTVYYMTLSKQFAEKSIDMLSQMILKPLFDKTEVDNEREVVIEEIKRGLDSSSQFASRNLFETVYKVHPYSRPVIGYDRIIRKTPVKFIKEFFAKRYHVKNMTLIVAGDFEKKEMKGFVKKYFGEESLNKFEKRFRSPEPKQIKPRISIKQGKFTDTINYIAWPIPKAKHRDTPALDLLSMILGYGESSLLSREIRNKEGIVNSVGCSTYTPKDKGLFILSANHEPDRLKDYFESVIKNLGQWIEVGVTPQDMKRAITNLESHEFYAMETVDGLANKYGSNQILMDDPDYFKKYIKELKELTPLDIMKVFKKYLKPESMSVAITSPADKTATQKEAKKFNSEFKKIHSSIKLKLNTAVKVKHDRIKLSKIKSKSKIEKIELEEGVSLISYPNYETATFSLQVAFEGGSFFENEKNLGTQSLMADSWLAGAGDLSEEELSNYLESKAIYISGFSGRNSAGLRLSCLSESYKDAMSSFFKIWSEPRFESQSIEREKVVLLNYLLKENDRPSQIAHNNLLQELFHGHVYAMEPMGDKESISKINRDKIIETHKKLIKNRRMVISAVGAFDLAKLKLDLKGQIKKLNRGKLELYPKQKLASIAENKTKRIKLDKEQTNIFVGFQAYNFTNEKVHALRVLESVMAGQGGRLFIELRDKASLAYSVSPMRMEGVDTGYFGAYIACSPEKEEKAIQMMFEEFSKLKDKGITSEELFRAKQNLIGSYDIQMQRNSSIASKLLFDELYGVGLREIENHTELVTAVTEKMVLEVAREIFSKNYVVSIVGRGNS